MRQPAVADRFYPGSPQTLTKTLTELLAPYSDKVKQKAKAVVAPHAGYIYSGALAAETLCSVEIPETVVILGPNHHGQGAAVALATSSWDMVLGEVPVDMEIGNLLLSNNPNIIADDSAHQLEHSLEVQVPFLQIQNPSLQIVPLVISRLTYKSCVDIGHTLAHAIAQSDKEVLIVASSDMSHYESRRSATKKDEKALNKIIDLDPAALYATVIDNRISMCGVIPVVIALHAAIKLGASTSTLIGYTESGYVSGDKQQVVGYAGFVIH
ncbi:MAG: AmmeMemoRadiSam system protein B [Desulforhopalus sp.]